MSEYTYYISAEKHFDAIERMKFCYWNDYYCGAWEEIAMPKDAMQYWSGHGTAFGYRKLTWKNIFRSRKYRTYIKSCDVSFDVPTLEEGMNLLASLQHLTKDDGVTIRLGVYTKITEEE